MPLDQWLYFDALECLPADQKLFPHPEDCAPVRTYSRKATPSQGQGRG